MAGKENKVIFGLKNVHYAKLTVGSNGKETYVTPVAIKGAVSLSVAPEGEIRQFFADNTAYFSSSSNKGYKGDLEVANLPESFRIDILGETKTNKGILVEKANVTPVPFALLFEFEGDEKAVRHVLYNCTCKRPNLESETTGDGIDPRKEKLEFEAVATSTGHVKGRTTAASDEATYNAWFNSVYMEGAN